MAKTEFNFHFGLRVRWSECDVQGLVYNASYINYLEVAQVEYFRNLDIHLYDIDERLTFDAATVKITMEFNAPARLDDLLEIYTRVSKLGSSSFTMSSEIYRHCKDALLVKSEVVYVNFDSAESASRKVPDAVRVSILNFEQHGRCLIS